MKRLNVGVFPCGSEVGLEINRALRYSSHFKLIGLNSINDHGMMVYEDYIGQLPLVSEKGFLPCLKEIIQNRQIQFLIPAMDEVAAYLKTYENELGCEIVCARKDVATLLTSKIRTYERLEGIVPVPKIFVSYEEIKKNLPVFSKPDIGYGSRNTELIISEEQLKRRWEARTNLIFCENLPGREYTIDCFSDTNHRVLFSGARIRRRIRMGISVNTAPVILERISEIAQRISETLHLEGVWFFQMKENKRGELFLLEIASRVSGSMALYRLKGVNFVLLELFQRLGYPVFIHENNIPNIELERSFDCKLKTSLHFDIVYVDFDDCLMIDQKVHTGLVRFLFQQVNKKRKIVLLTKHNGDIHAQLKRLRLSVLFDEIIHIDTSMDKSSYINSENAIFIDDSYQERVQVAERLKIPVFAPDVVESLIDYRSL